MPFVNRHRNFELGGAETCTSRAIVLGVLIIGIAVAGRPVNAATTSGPTIDFRDEVHLVPTPFTITTNHYLAGILYVIPFLGCYTGTETVFKDVPQTIRVSWTSYDTRSSSLPTPIPIPYPGPVPDPIPSPLPGPIPFPNTPEYSVVLTEVIGIDLTPAGQAGVGPVTGFDPLHPELVLLSPLTITGASGATYVADVNLTTTMENLGVVLGADFDISQFIGAPNSIVYVSQVTVPLAEATFVSAIPEPSTGLLLVAGIAACIAARQRMPKL
jgi:hypothetical protein